MKQIKHFLFSATLLFVVVPSLAQLSIMPKVGASMANVTVTDDMLDGSDKPKSKIGIVGGVAFEYSINDLLAIQPELLFHQKGAKYDYSGDGYEVTETYSVNYLDLPILVKVKFGNFYASAGPSFSYGIGGKYKFEWSGQGDSGEETAKIKFGDEPANNEDDVYFDNAMDVGGQVGVGGKLGPLVVDLRYGMGFSNVNDKPDGFPGDWKWKNKSLQLTVGFPIPGM